MDTTHIIPAHRLAYLQTRIADLAKRAAKLSLSVAIGLEVLRSFDEEVSRFGDIVVTRPLVEVRVFGEAPRLNGWHLRGRLSPRPDAQTSA